MTAMDLTILCLTAAVGAGINAVAGGGTLLTFPALIGVLSKHYEPDVAKVWANGTSTVALFPATLAASWGLRREFVTYGHWAKKLIPPSIVGGVLGTLLVTEFPEKIFAALVPYLILMAASLFALQPVIARTMGIGKAHEEPHGRTVIGVVIFQFIVGVYGGYFGAGIGILMLSALAMMGMSDIHGMNALKGLLAGCVNGASVAVWLSRGKIEWRLAIPMAIAGCLGAFLAATFSRRLPKAVIRWFVICIGFTLAAYYFLSG